MTASTPPLVDVIAAANAAHAPNVIYYSAEEGHVACHGCSGEWPSFHGFHEHQARAVLDALTKAGGVQFGVKGEGRVKEYGRDRRSAQLEARRRRVRFVSRITGPWTEVAG